MRLERGENKMNQNIEVINKHLWAVKFSFLPFISEISYKPDSEIPLEEQFGSISDDGVIILNKDYKGYTILRDNLYRVMSDTNRNLKKKKKYLEGKKGKSLWESFYLTMVNIELVRRKLIDKNDSELKLKG